MDPNPVPTPPITPVPVAPQPKSNLPLILVCLVLMVLIGIGGFVAGSRLSSYTPTSTTIAAISITPDPTANWRTITNTNGYSIKIPSDSILEYGEAIRVHDSEDPNPLFARIYDPNKNLDAPHITILVQNETGDIKRLSQELYNKNVSSTGIPAISIQIPTLTTLDGQPAYEFIVENKGFEGPGDSYLGYTGKYKAVWTTKNNKLFFIQINTPEHDQILSTFKFNDKASELKNYSFPQAKISFLVPEELNVSLSQPNPEVFALYIQNYQNSVAEIDKPYQLYGLFQPGIYDPDIYYEELKTDLEPASIKEVKISGFPAVEGQIKGERNRFVTHILTNTGKWSLFTSEPTIENKNLTEQILSTLKFTN